MNNFRTFYKDNKERLFGYLLRKTGDYALTSDIMQESFTRFLERYKDREYKPALLFAISRNLLYDHARKNRPETVYDVEQLGVEVDQENNYLVKEECRKLLTAMQQLSDGERDILALAVSGNLSYREIAEIAGTSEANIKVKIHRSRTKLKKILQDEKK